MLTSLRLVASTRSGSIGTAVALSRGTTETARRIDSAAKGTLAVLLESSTSWCAPDRIEVQDCPLFTLARTSWSAASRSLCVAVPLARSALNASMGSIGGWSGIQSLPPLIARDYFYCFAQIVVDNIKERQAPRSSGGIATCQCWAHATHAVWRGSVSGHGEDTDDLQPTDRVEPAHLIAQKDGS